MHEFLLWLQATGPATAIAESTWLFPLIETLHVVGLAFVIGSIGTFDLRILGLAWPSRPIETLTADILPWTWGGFVLAVVTGLLMFISAAATYAANPVFQFKLGLLLFAGLNVLFFHFHPHRRRVGAGRRTPAILRVSAALSLSTWVAMVGLGRWIAFV